MEMYLGIALMALYVLPRFVIDYVQLNFVKQKLQQPAILLNTEDYKRAGEYTIACLKYSMFSAICEGVILLFWFCCGLGILESFWGTLALPEFWQDVVYFLSFLVIYIFISILFNFYTEMVLDKRFGFSKMTLRLFFLDSIKALLLTFFLGGILTMGMVFFIDYTSLWWLWAFIFMFFISVLINAIYPTVIAPIFNRFTPLRDENLKAHINELLKSVGFESSGIFVMDASKRDGRLNAYFGGLSKSKRVILFDTLLEKVSTDGLLAILGHELGHFKHHDIVKNLFLNAIVLFVIFFLAGVGCSWILNLIGIAYGGGEILACIVLFSPIVLFWLKPILGVFSRRAEYRADEFGASLSSKPILANALIRIINENRSFPYAHTLYTIFYHTHPPLMDRLRALEYEL